MRDLRNSYAIGLDIGSTHVAAAQLTKKNNRTLIGGLFYRDLDPRQENDDVLVSALTDIRRSGRFSGRRVVLSVPSKNLSIFPLHFRLDEALSLDDAILAEAEKFLPFPLGEAIMDYPSLVGEVDGHPGSYKAVVAAMRRGDAERYMALLREARLRVEAIDLSVSALIRLHHYLCGVSPNPVILGYVGHSKSILVVFTGESIAIQRIIDWGSATLLEEFLKHMDIPDDRYKARAILKRYGLTYEHPGPTKAVEEEDPDAVAGRRAVYQIIAPHIDEFLHEMDKAISYARVEERHPEFEGIYLYGQATLVSSLDHYVESRLNMKTRILDPVEKMDVASGGIVSDIPPDAPLAVALGLAMRRVPWP
jgi:type IV pilus assembly protein PilM